MKKAKAAPDPRIEMVGDLLVVLPCPADRLSDLRLADLRRVADLMRRGQRREAHRQASALETALGITHEMRLAAVKPREGWEADLEEALSLAAANARQPVPLTRKERRRLPFPPLPGSEPIEDGRISLPAGERGLPQVQIDNWERSREILTSPHLRLSEQQRDDRARAIADIETRQQREREQVEITAGLIESQLLAQDRGERVEVLKSGAMRIDDRDSLLRLLRLGLITLAQHDAGKAFRDLYEARFEGAGSQIGDPSGGAHNNDRFVMTRLKRAKRLQRIVMVEVAIVHGVILRRDAEPLKVKAHAGFAQAGLDPAVARDVFRGVCAENLSLKSFGGGRGFSRNLLGLRLALDVAVEVIKG